MERIEMSQQERDWLDWLKRAGDKKMTQREAAEKMGVGERWVRHLLRRLKKEGDRVVVHGLRGRTSNRKIAAETEKRALKALEDPEWHDFGPTFACEQLAKRHQIEVSDETLRQWMIKAGIWKSRERKLGEVHCWRPRRTALGELVQWDTSDHDWLEGRGPVRYLVRLIDDATSWSWGRFVERDATPFNMAVLWEYIEKNGRMVDVYTDRDSMFTVPLRAGQSEQQRIAEDRLTQLGRALREWESAPSWRFRRKPRAASNAVFSPRRIVWSSTCAWPKCVPSRPPTRFWSRSIGRSGTIASPVGSRTSPTNIVNSRRIWIWRQRCVMSKSASSPTTTRFPLPAAIFRSRAKTSRPACAGNACASRFVWMASCTHAIEASI